MAGRSENRTQVQLIVCSPPLAANVRAPIHPFCRCCCSFSFIQTKEPSSRPKLLARFASSAVEKPASLPRPLPERSEDPPAFSFCRCSCFLPLFLLSFFLLPLHFLLSSPKRICFCPYSRPPATNQRVQCPIHRALCDGWWDCRPSAGHQAVVFALR
jgi:hypothetical protein